MIVHHLGRGSRRFVLPMPLEMAVRADRIDALAALGLPLCAVRFQADIDLLRRRVDARDRSDHRRALEHAAVAEQKALAETLPARFCVLEVTGQQESSSPPGCWPVGYDVRFRLASRDLQ